MSEECTLDKMLRIYSGSSHWTLAGEIAKYLGCKLCDRETQRFTNDNLSVYLAETVRRKEVVLIQSFVPHVSDHLLELLMMADAARSASAKCVHAVIPYYSYARSDKKDKPRISISGRLIADLLQTAGVDHVVTMELHSPQVHGFFRVPTDHLTSHSVFLNYFRKRDLHDTVVVAPDMGQAKRASRLARALGVGFATGDKERLADDRVYIMDVIGDMAENAIILDDEVATGGTVIELIEKLRLRGTKRVILACTHGVFSGQALERLASIPEVEQIVTTNTVPISEERRQMVPKLEVLSVAPIFAEALRRNIKGESVGALFAFWPEEQEGASAR